jgi:protein-tyrosine-phosphatase
VDDGVKTDVRRPSSVLFACDHNAVRSPMAEGIMKHYFGDTVYVDSVGIRSGELERFAVAAMAEADIDISAHKPKRFDELQDTSFDIIVSLSPGAQHAAVELTRTMACDLLYWQTFDATAVRGSREVRLDAFRQTRDLLAAKILDVFDPDEGLGPLSISGIS